MSEFNIDSFALDLMRKVWEIGNGRGPDSQRKAQIQVAIAEAVEPLMTQQAVELAALRYTNDGALAECPCCGSLDVGGAHDTVNCYRCGLAITKKPPLKNAIDAWNKRALHTAPQAQPDGEIVVTWDESQTTIIAVTRQDAEGKVLSVIAEAPTEEYRIPCDVKLPPNTRFSRGCRLSTVIAGMEMRRNGIEGISMAQAQRFAATDEAQPAPIPTAERLPTEADAEVVVPIAKLRKWSSNCLSSHGYRTSGGEMAAICDGAPVMVDCEHCAGFGDVAGEYPGIQCPACKGIGMVEFLLPKPEQPAPIPRNERMPALADADPFGMVAWWNSFDNFWVLTNWDSKPARPIFTHWLPTGLTMPPAPGGEG